ncbi:unnamed protein product [Owenia fusiformis]|uniref:Uncharacterized protein n=1 Tax=Owenia fusiformis TaxID=6347 RepID=A0A8S4NZT9_OWEFU|nr:unnamed protein product [Owenia fusiformis]
MATIIDPYSPSKHTLSAQLKSLIETNKNIYRNDLKEKQFNSKDEQKLIKSIELENSDDAGVCRSMLSESRIHHDVTYFVFPFSYDPLPIDVTLSSHLTLSRHITQLTL